MHCPVCAVALTPLEYEGIIVESCRKCGGDWLDHDEIKKITAIRERRFDADALRAVASAASYHGVPAEEDVRIVGCPKCSAHLSPRNYGGGSGVIIDYCEDCQGYWLDGDELEKVQVLVEGWEDGLEGDLAHFGATLHGIDIATEALDQSDEYVYSRLPIVGRFINSIVNGILDLKY